MSSEIERVYARLEQLGPDAVRTMMTSGSFPTGWNVHIGEWLAKKDHEVRLSASFSQAEQTEIARRASDAAERAATAAERAATAAEEQATEARRANKKANIALAIAIISTIITAIVAIVSIALVHFDAIRQLSGG